MGVRAFAGSLAGYHGQPARAPHTSAAVQSAAWPLLRLGGRAGQEDALAIARRLGRVPPALLEAGRAAGLRVVVCRGAVTDHVAGYRGYQAPGWPAGWKYDHVPGIYLPDQRAVVIATTATLSGGRGVPRRGRRHDSFDLTLHEFGHAVDKLGILDGQGSRGAYFIACYRADLPVLANRGERHLAQGGVAGLQEAFGESFARFFGGDPTLEATAPNMYRYWRRVADALGWRVGARSGGWTGG